MKYYIKTTFLTLLSLILLLFVLFVDTTFYHVPSFIKIYWFERELTIIIAFLVLLPVIKSIFTRLKLGLKQTLLFIWGSIVSLFLIILIPQLFLKSYLVLWDNNLFLAEYPLIWNVVSGFCILFTISILILILLSIKELLNYRPGKFSNFEMRCLIWLFLIFSLMLNFIEDRYSFEQITILQSGFSSIIWIFGGLMVIITLLISYHKPWIDILNKKEKYLGFILFIVVLPIGIYLIMSRLLLPVYAFSTTVKGFALSSFAFINVYMIVSFLGLLFRLPTASLYDRVSQEILAISKISQMISLKENTSKVFDSVVEYVCLLTESDACWLMLQNEELENLPIVSSVHLSDIDRSILELPEACCLGNWVIDKKEPVLVHNVSTDERTVHLKMLDVKWKSILAVPLFRDDSVVGILYSAKKSSYAYDEKDLNTLKSFGIQINIALGNADISGSAKVIDADRIMSKPSVQILNNEKIELAVSVINSASTSLTIGFVPVSSKEICFYSVCLTESGHEMEMELRGVLKTLFTLESDFNKVFIKTIDILCDSKRIKDLLLNLFLFDEQLSEMRVVSNFPLAVMCFKHSSQTTISSITKMLENKPDIKFHLYTCNFPVKSKDRILIVPDQEPGKVEFEELVTALDSTSVSQILEMVYKKINPDSLFENQQISGLISAIKFK